MEVEEFEVLIGIKGLMSLISKFRLSFNYETMKAKEMMWWSVAYNDDAYIYIDRYIMMITYIVKHPLLSMDIFML